MLSLDSLDLFLFSLSRAFCTPIPVFVQIQVGTENMHKDSKYVLFLDDDVRPHPESIGALTREMEKTLRNLLLLGLEDGSSFLLGAHKRLITSPPVAVFPHPLASDLNFGRYWNYLRKQTFVLESYTTKVNWIMNRVLSISHCYLSWGFVAPYVMAMVHVAAALRFYVKGYSHEEMTCFSGGLSLVSVLTLCTFVELLSMWNLTRIEVHLCNALSPEAPWLSLASYNWCLVFIAMLVDNFLYAVSAIRSRFSQSINWSGIRYYLKNGQISKIKRTQKSKDMEPVFRDLGRQYLYGKKDPLESHCSVLCPEVWRNGVIQRN